VSNLSFFLTEVETLAPPPAVTPPPAVVPPEDYVEEVTLPPRPTKSPVPSTLDFHGPGLFGPDTGLGRWINVLKVIKMLFFFSVMNLAASSGTKLHTSPLSLSSVGMPSCLLCACISSSVYCDDSELTQIPPLPKETTHFYARFNKITEVKATDFINLSKNQMDFPLPYPFVNTNA